MRRRLSLHVWLAVALALVIAVPALAGLAAWAGAGQWQAGREAGRRDQAVAVLRTAQLDTADQRDAVSRRLAALGVESQLGPTVPDAKAAIDAADPKDKVDMSAKMALANKPELLTPGFEQGAPRARLDSYRQSAVTAGNLAGLVWVPRESTATRLAIALGAGLAALGAALVAILVLLRRWVLQPLARLAADAERIAGGELDVEPLPTRAREVAQVGDALHGMAGALGDALKTSAAAERERRFMVTAIAHDLRTPLFTLRGSLEGLERGVGDERYLDRAQAKAAHLDRLISDLFTFSRLEYAPDAIGADEVDLAALARRAAEDVEPLFRSDRARATATGGTGLGLAIARHLARAHGGDVEAGNEPGGGGRTTVRLPAA